ncbi:1-deoxy-D-xylulose-5-phosphate synthase [Rhodospirillales bacterium]|nr:1-deoxy-D-xylulose-5-phosphate synthase [Rhodospirillales bacterium]
MDTKVNNTSKPKLMRDAVIDTIYNAAKEDKNIIFISADLGAAALDKFRKYLPGQFIHAGISEQNMVDLASGLALSGKKVFLYAMAPFITARCYEQIKSVLASMNLPVTLIAVGVGLGYDHATMTHFTTEDVACMRALNGIEVLSPSDENSAIAITRAAINKPAFRYIRLERQPQRHLYRGNFTNEVEQGFVHLVEGVDVVIVGCGYLVHKALLAKESLEKLKVSAGVIDLFRIKKINAAGLISIISSYPAVVTIEEQILDGGFGSAVLETLSDQNVSKPLKRLGIGDGFDVVNGDRDQLHELYGIDTPNIVEAALSIIGT